MSTINQAPKAPQIAPESGEQAKITGLTKEQANQITGLTEEQVMQLLYDDPIIDRERDFEELTVERPDTTPDSLDPQTEHHQANEKFIKALQGQIDDGNGGAIQELLIKTLQEENNTKTSPLHTAKLYTLVTLHLGSLGLKLFKNLIFGSKR